jgi:hypothetical protein
MERKSEDRDLKFCTTKIDLFILTQLDKFANLSSREIWNLKNQYFYCRAHPM